MRYVGLALYAEGPTDYHFLSPVLLRLCSDIAVRRSDAPIEFPEEVLALDHPTSAHGAPREERIVAAAKEARGAWRLLFVHTDGSGDPTRARDDLVRPALARLQAECSAEGVGIAVVPVRETEAWALADGEAIREAFGTAKSDTELGIPRASAIEALTDPKQRLVQVFLATQPTARIRRAGPSTRLTALGEAVRLERLRLLAGFQALEADLIRAMQQLGIVPGS